MPAQRPTNVSAWTRFGLGSGSLGLGSARLGLGWLLPQLGSVQPGLTRLGSPLFTSAHPVPAQLGFSFPTPYFVSHGLNTFVYPLRAAPTH